MSIFVFQSEEVVQLPSAASSGKVDLIEYENPADLIKALLEQLGGSASINKICKVGTVVFHGYVCVDLVF